MTDDINNYSFDFMREVLRLKSELGPPADNIVFFNVDMSQPLESAFSHTTHGKNITEADLDTAFALGMEEYVDYPAASSKTLPHIGGNMGHYAVYINHNSFNLNQFGKRYEALSRLNSLYHEAGHCLIPGNKKVDNLHPREESNADAFAALCLLKRFGRSAIPFLSMRSWQRALTALGGNTGHLTAPVIDKIIADSAMRDFTKLATDEITALAKEYAEQWTPTADALSAARAFFRDGKKRATVKEALASTCLSSSCHELAFLVGAKVVQPLLQPQGMLYDGELFHLTAEDRENYISAINSRLVAMKLDGVFNTAAAKAAAPASLVSPIILPRGQKQFVYNQH